MKHTKRGHKFDARGEHIEDKFKREIQFYMNREVAAVSNCYFTSVCSLEPLDVWPFSVLKSMRLESAWPTISHSGKRAAASRNSATLHQDIGRWPYNHKRQTRKRCQVKSI